MFATSTFEEKINCDIIAENFAYFYCLVQSVQESTLNVYKDLIFNVMYLFYNFCTLLIFPL